MCDAGLKYCQPICMYSGWTKKVTKKHPWIQDYVNLIMDDAAKSLIKVISSNDANNLKTGEL